MNMDYCMTTPIRILHVFGSMGRAGAEALVMNIYRHISPKNIQFDFLVHTTEECYYDKEIIARGGRIISIEPPKSIGLRNYNEKLRKILREQGPFQGIHSHVFFFSGWVLKSAYAVGIPLRIAHSHNVLPNKVSLIKKIYHQFMRRLMYRYATHFIACAVSAGVCLYGSRFQTESRSTLVKNAIDLSTFLLEDQHSKPVRKELDINEDSLVIGHVGRFDPQKNHIMIIHIFQKLLQKQQNSKLILIGTGKLFDEVRELVVGLGISDSVIFCGQRDDISRLMQAFDVFLFPSIHEGLGIVLLEAQASGIPCVVSHVIPEEANLNVGLLQQVHLNETPDYWAEQIIAHRNVQIPSVTSRKQALEYNGYDILKVSSFLEGVYGCGAGFIKN